MRLRLLWLLIFVLCAGSAFGQTRREAMKDLPFTPPRKWAVVIGANDYSELGKLSYATSDAKAFAGVLQERFGFQSESIELITDSPDSKLRPTVETINGAIDSLIQDARFHNGDLFIFYFSGHGIGTPKGDFLMPTDLTQQSVDAGVNVKEVIQKFVKAGMRNVLFIVDACRGGQKNNFGDDLRKLGKSANISVILGCEPGARSYEYPQLGHGVFTNFLLKALRSKDMQSAVTGALWASSVAMDVQKKVFEYTQRDHPTQPQNPTGWTDKTMDVMLGAFPSKAEVRVKLNDVLADSQRLDPQMYVNSLRTYVEALLEQDRKADAVELFRVIDTLKQLSPADRVEFGLALSDLGRMAEMQNQFAILEKQKDSAYYALMAKLLNPSRLISPQEKVKAAWDLWALEKTPSTAMIAWGSLQVYASKADSNKLLQEALKLSGLEKRIRLFWEGQLVANNGQWEEAAKLWRQGEQEEGDMPSVASFKGFLFQAIAFSGKESEIDTFLQSAAKDDPESGARWHLVRAQRLADQGKTDQAVEALKAALDANPTPDSLLWVIRIAGSKFPLIKDQVVREAEKYPFAWKAMLAKTWVTKLSEGFDAISEALNEASKYSDDEFAVAYECFRFLDGMLDETLAAGKMTPELYMQLMVAYSTTMAQNIDQLGYDAFAWQLLNKFGLMAEKYEQLNALYDLKLGKALDQGVLDPMLQAPYLMVALSMGNDPRIDQLWKVASFYPADQNDSALLYSIYQATKGRLELAKGSMPKGATSSVFAPVRKAYEAYLSVLEGKETDLSRLLPECKGNPAAMQLIALSYAHKKDWAHADPLLAEYAFQRLLAMSYLQASVAEAYLNRLIATKQFDKANQSAHTIAISSFGNPLFAKVHFGERAAVASFAGSIELDAFEVEMLPDVEEGTLSLIIDAKGSVTGKATIAKKDRTIQGSIDAYGNLKATVKEGDKTWTITGKIAQPALYKSMPIFKTSAQGFLLLDDKGQARYLMGRAR